MAGLLIVWQIRLAAPSIVLLTDREAEHIPGCNMAYRKSALLEIGGFDERFRVAGDDVDVCWSLQKHNWKLGFSPAAVVAPPS